MLEAKNITKHFTHSGKKLCVLDDVCFFLNDGEFCSLVGESGSGKSTLAQVLCGLIPADSGAVELNGEKITPKSRQKNNRICSEIQLVLQNAKSAVDPCFTVYDCIAEPIRNLTDYSRAEEKKRIAELIELMELPLEMLNRKAYQLSGGQQKRICIARALAANPRIIVFDEAVSGLDVIVRKNILDLLIKLQKETKMSFLFITHDMDVALYTSQRIAVMRGGKILEQVHYSGDCGVFSNSYSKQLLKSAMINEE